MSGKLPNFYNLNHYLCDYFVDYVIIFISEKKSKVLKKVVAVNCMVDQQKVHLATKVFHPGLFHL